MPSELRMMHLPGIISEAFSVEGGMYVSMLASQWLEPSPVIRFKIVTGTQP